ncbi:hypothetical protein AVEN_55519-1 [Araneus ventricosus]|uniref:Uncharacterized protein n=1 Tax=Araneus ventricosus TaxID=182803 RepID=A0A4Y2CAY0_ARAVE|nr:hypothetical protein AVEN_55519-1 [Araneus ventricosus]
MSVPPSDDSRIITPFFPSLFHIALVKIAAPFLLEFDIETLDRVFTDIQHGISARINEGSQNDHKAKRAHEKILSIPAHLRRRLFKTITGMYCEFYRWLTEHSRIFSWKVGITVYWRSDGTINTTKTAEHLVQNENINIRERFHLACIFCLEESVQTLWKEMEASGETKNFETGNKYMTSFWVRWMQEGSRLPWLQAVEEYLVLPPALSKKDLFRCSPFFPLLRSENRKKFITFFDRTCYDDIRLCLYAATKEEQVKILKEHTLYILLLYLNWPLQSFFLEIAEMVWHFLDMATFCTVLKCIWICQEQRKDFDYCELFVEFWNRCPVSLREIVKEHPTVSITINSILNKIRRKRERESISDTNQNKWIRISGRLESTTSLFDSHKII